MPRRRFIRIRIPLLLSVGALLLAVLAYIFGMSHYQAQGAYLYEPNDLYIPRSIDVVIAMWCLWVGAAIGSFLNVVAWRMPRGESINGRSHCPRCLAKLQARDNFPVFGWLALGGRCRTCHLAISPRYPIVEAVVGLTIMVVSIAELYRLCLPRQTVHWHGGPLWAPTVDHVILITLVYHVTALAFCWACGLIRMDKHRLPGRLIVCGMLAAIVPMMVYPRLMIAPWQLTVPEFWWPEYLYIDALVRVVTALVAATLIGRFLARGLCPTADPKLDPLAPSTARLIDLIAILAIPIVIVGWQASPALTVLASLLALALRRCLPGDCDALGRFAMAMPLALAIQLILWRYFEELWFWPSNGSQPWVFLVWVGLVGVTPLWLREEPGEPIPIPIPPPKSEDQATDEDDEDSGISLREITDEPDSDEG